jgi:hypothetical protein
MCLTIWEVRHTIEPIVEVAAQQAAPWLIEIGAL